jgi:hypothetical protein
MDTHAIYAICATLMTLGFFGVMAFLVWVDSK